MLEQQERPADESSSVDAQSMTQLEGIRNKVFTDRYSLKDASGKPLELYPENTWARVARGIAAVEQTEEKRAYWEKRFYEALTNFQFVPGGRILAGAGSGHQVTFYNCFSSDTLIHTRQGIVPISTLQGNHEVLSEGGVYRMAFFKSYGQQQLWQVTLANGTIIHATAEHQWVANKEKGGTERIFTRNLAGRTIPINARPTPEYDTDFAEGVQHGIVYGDGSIQYGKAHVCLFGEKEELAGWFGSYDSKASGGTVATKEHVRIQALPAEWKALPLATASPAHWRGFIAGLIATDGHVDERGSVAIYNKDAQVLATIADNMAIAGLVSSGITMTREHSPYTGEVKPVYRLQLIKATLTSRDILKPQHLKNFVQSQKARKGSMQVASVCPTERFEEVFCCVEPETHTITVGHGYLTGQCYVIPSPEDSRNGILDNLKLMTEIMARGGGVGINLSTLRPRGSYIKTVNGTASGPCSWAQLYSVATGDVIQQGGCFGPHERIATDRGLIPAQELANRLDAGESIQAQTHKGLRKFNYVFRNGIKDLYEVTTSRGYKVRVTLDHKMGVLRNGEVITLPLRELEEGDEILLLLGEGTKNDIPLVSLSSRPYKRSKMSTTLNENVKLPTHLTAELAYLLGFFYGDGSLLQDEKGISLSVENSRPDITNRLTSLIKDLFALESVVSPGDGACTNVRAYSHIMVEWLQENGFLKQKTAQVRVPEAIFKSSSLVVSAFLAGYFDADGCDRGKKAGYGFDSVSREMLEDVQLLLIAQGIVSHIVVQDRTKQGWLSLYRLLVTGAQFKERFSKLIFTFSSKDKQRQGYHSHNSNYPMEASKALGIPGRYYQGLFDSTKERVSHYALTRVRDSVIAAGGAATLERLDALLGVVPDSIISISPLGPSEVLDFEVDDIHLLAGGGVYTSNSRRGALMLMLDDTHPDVEEFITVKRTAGKIEHANLSVAISDKFMAAVKDDTKWDLTWQGEVKKTIRARDLWDLICKSAWESAEPGMVFMDRYNTESNTWYYENIRCVNPCVTGDTLIYTDRGLYTAKELADIGLPITVASPDIAVGELVPSRDAVSRMKAQITKQSPSKNVSLRQASHVFSTGYKSVYRLQTEEGYTLRLTRDHKVLTLEGWKEAGELVPGNQIHLLHGEGGFGSIGNEELGKVYGWLVGDGHINTSGKGSACLGFWGTERVLAQGFANDISKIIGDSYTSKNNRSYSVSVIKIEKRDHVRIESERLLTILDHELLTEKLQVPPSVMRGNKGMQKGFLSALFTADGCVLGNQEKGVSVRLTSVSQTLLENVQRILLNFGIGSQIYKNRRNADQRLLPDGKGDYASYECKSYHEIIISGNNLSIFAQQIGFLVEEKQGKLEDTLKNYKRALNQERFLATFESLLPDGKEEVYDLTEPEAHLFVANGLVVHNCGEQGLAPYGVCNLGALNLASFVQDGLMDWAHLAEMSKVSMRFLDNVIDANEYFIKENEEAQMGTRRTGLGTMGLADALIKMQVAYGSEESLPIIERIYATIRDASYDAAADNAVEKGTFPMFDREKYMQGRFIKRLPKSIQDKIKKQGIRNAVLLTQAPTGTTSLLAGVSSGIEPVYDFAMIRRDRTGEHIMYHPLLQEWRDAHPDETTAPSYYVASKDLTPEEHVRVQAIVQSYTDSSISKTVNAPNEHTVEQVQKLYRLAYESGCKGITYYRDGSRDAVLTRVADEQKAAEKAQQPVAPTVVNIHDGVKQRPALVEGYTRQVRAPEGKINITINSDSDGPLEVFVNVGKAGSDIAALAEALGRLISLNLQILSPVSQSDRAQEIADQLRNIGGNRSVGFGQQQIRSLPDAVARALELHMASLQTGEAAKTAVHEAKEHHALHMDGSAPLSLTHLTVTGNLCPQCGCNTMVNEEGCRKCYSCGHSEC